ncbi:ABC transporter permease [Clostridium sp. AF18-27]|uniref:Oligopeptide transport system permease protein n=1 Tax=Enterocloster lavalensis TaxID=460384 RepID=A0A1I0HQT7_9FIRM|nr:MULTISPECIES: ABC transporter permease [Enterocloster]MBS5602910.1 ABC transporter permease [Enterocloster asparagiformis]RHR56157.1 ABC transporter permease [Clostridium sp. AF18-27]MCB6341479.1 ABC transporter permease [Enterocloster lavalensis]MDR3758044.1 ABC transporter permease [Enterocloster sp.]PST32124.1 ABC transporter permease [Enterocloster lavalensis]
MLKYLVKRIGTAVITLFVAATITFFVMNLVPGDPFMSEKAPTAAAKAAMEAKYGLDKPLVVQYANYLKNLLHGDFGVSYVQAKNKPIMDIIKQAFPISAKIGAIAVVVATVIGIPLGCLSALRREKWQDNVIRVLSTVGIAVPGFVVATSFMILFAVKLKLVPASGLSSAAAYVLPVVTLALSPCSYIARLMRSSMLDVIGQDYIRTARAKGMSEFITTFKHALRNSLIPVITYMGPMIANVLTGGFVVEKIFNIPGLGRYFVKSIESRDYTIIMGVTIFYAAILILMTLVCDIIYKLVDPRIKLDA